MSARHWLVTLMMAAIAGCATHQGRCDGRLRPINVPVAQVQTMPGVAP